jgi:hypothetical protein
MNTLLAAQLEIGSVVIIAILGVVGIALLFLIASLLTENLVWASRKREIWFCRSGDFCEHQLEFSGVKGFS